MSAECNVYLLNNENYLNKTTTIPEFRNYEVSLVKLLHFATVPCIDTKLLNSSKLYIERSNAL